MIIAMGCDKQDIDQAGHFRIGVPYEITSTLLFTINSINDSRCPEGLVCIIKM